VKKISFIFGLIFLLFFFSCKSAPEPLPEEIPEETAIPIVESVPEEIVTPAIEPTPEVNENPLDETPLITIPPEEPEMDDYHIDLLEPTEPEEEIPAATESENEDLPAELPNETPDIMIEPTPAIVPSDPPAETQSLPEEEAPEQEQVPPLPPAFLRPAEPIQDDTIVREAIPMPVNPIPELPANHLEEDNSIVFSRTVRATVGQLIEIPFRGTGWVFLGEIGSRRGIAYDSRRLDPEGQSFIFLAEEPGTYILKLYTEDYIRDYILNDHVQVLIGEAPEPSGTGWFNPPSDWSRVIAEPRWPIEAGAHNSNVPEETSLSASPQPSPEKTAPTQEALPKIESSILDEEIIPDNPPLSPLASTEDPAMMIPEYSSPEEYIMKAQEEFDAGRIAEAISILEQFRQYYPSGSDEAFWLLGRFYEANSPSRDIRTSLDCYNRLVDEYPQSRRYADAIARIAYLERYYLNIR
jgi:hypothetical protein